MPTRQRRDIPIIDAHVHVNRFDLMAAGPKSVIVQNPTFALMERFMRSPDAFLQHLDAEGIDAAWLINYCARDVMGYGWEVNPWISEYCSTDPKRLIAVGGYDPREDGAGAAAVDRVLGLGIRAIKMHPVHMRLAPDAHRRGNVVGGNLSAAYARAEELRIPIIFHTGTSIFPGAANEFSGVAPIANVCADFPELAVVLAHGGRPHETAEALAILRAHPNAWLEVSSCPPKRLPEYFGDLEALAPRTIWGSDWPGPKVPGMGANVDSFLALGLSPKANRLILHDNATSLLAKSA
jgi:predicted TIM-barrel fold metal-dependent hydrolase